MKSSIQDVAQLAHVSISTVSRSFTRPDLVSKATRDKVMKAADELNFSISRSAAALKTGRALRIAVLVSGRLQTGSYVNKDGQRVYTTEVILDDQEFADSKGAASEMGGYAQAAPSQRPAPTSAIGDGFMNIPDGVVDEGLPFN